MLSELNASGKFLTLVTGYIIFVKGVEKVGRKIFNSVESGVMDKLSDTSSEMSIAFSSVSGKFDTYVVDGMVNSVKTNGQIISENVRKLQRGITEQYAFAFAIGVLVIAMAMIFIF